MAGTGGKRKGAGRKSKADEEKVNNLFVNALKQLYNKDDDDEAKIDFIKELAESQRGQIFIAEHVFGKPKDTVDTKHTFVEGFSIKDLYGKDKKA
tara:strand:+ start:68 stop:352 length:285 start_codon:yes stop_codon:yes gene_type:complete